MLDSETSSKGDGGFGGEILVAAIVFFLMAIFFIIFIYIYTRWRFGPGSADRRARAVLDEVSATPRGLDPDVMKSLPVISFKSTDFKDGVECAVCLSEIADGEKARLLPKCNHGFHLECIDMWLSSHSTCPLCRNSIGDDPELSSEAAPEMAQETGSTLEPLSLPTNVLFWGSESGGMQEARGTASVPAGPSSSSSSSSASSMLVIEIPRRVVEGFSSSSSSSPLPSSRFLSEDMKSPASTMTTPTSSRFRSFRRLFSRGSGAGSPGGAVDIEQGVGVVGRMGRDSSVAPKTPTIS